MLVNFKSPIDEWKFYNILKDPFNEVSLCSNKTLIIVLGSKSDILVTALLKGLWLLSDKKLWSRKGFKYGKLQFRWSKKDLISAYQPNPKDLGSPQRMNVSLWIKLMINVSGTIFILLNSMFDAEVFETSI